MSMDPSSNLREARRLGDLGYFKDAAAFYAAAEAEHSAPQLSLILEVSGFNMEQGLAGVVLDRLNATNENIDRRHEVPLQLALLDLLWAFVEAQTTVRLARPLEKVVKIFNEHLRNWPHTEYDKKRVGSACLNILITTEKCVRQAYLVAIYHNFCKLIELMGFSKDEPPPTMNLEQMRTLFDEMTARKEYKVAFQLAQCYAGLPDAGIDTSLLETLIELVLDDSVLRAAIFLQYAETCQSQDKVAEAMKYLEASEELYSATGHAFGNSMIQLKRLREGDAEDRQERINAVLKIKAEQEFIGNWDGVRQALNTLTAINNQIPDDSLSTILNIEYLELRDVRRNDIDWVSQRVLIASRWKFNQENIGQSLRTLETLYAEIKHMDAPIELASVVMMLYEINVKVGDAERALLWLTEQRHVLPRVFRILHDLDDFFRHLQATTTAPDPELECASLQEELDATTSFLLKTNNLSDRAVELGRVANIANIYAAQYMLRGAEQTVRLIDMCKAFIDQSYALLAEKDQKDIKARVLQTLATLKILEAAAPPFTLENIPEKIDLWLMASTLNQEAHDLYTSIEKWTSVSMAKAQKANCLQTAWLLQGSPSDSTIFHEATDLYVEALELSKKISHQTSVRSHTMALVKLWFKGFEKNISMPPTTSDENLSLPIQMVVKYLIEVDLQMNVERNDLSALKNERSILAKQNLRKRPEFAELYDIGVKMCASIPDTTPLWDWVQTMKSRGVSDLLALGIILPASMMNTINEDAALRRLMEEERQKQIELDSAPTDSKFYLTKELEMYRKKMRSYRPLADLLDLREGQPIEIEVLRNLQELRAATHASGSTQRGVVFVDWFVYKNNFAVLIVTKTAIHAIATSFTIAAAQNWKNNYLIYDSSRERWPLEDEDSKPLQELSSLIQPLIAHSEEGDLLVFCPTGALHGIPLHAATLDEEAEKSIIDRNPIVYTSSMTTLNHCISRELQHTQSGADPSGLNQSFVAVFEETDEVDADTATFESFRDSVYEKVQKIGSDFSDTRVTVGKNVSPEVLRQSFECDMMYFFGHCQNRFDSILQQALKLAPVDGEMQLAADLTNLDITGDARIPSRDSSTYSSGKVMSQSAAVGDFEVFPRFAPHHFTVGDIFQSKVQASNIMLIACGSASESNAPGDEPLGLVTALLCAGASSVIGTLWEVKAGRAATFSQRFYKILLEEINTAKSVRSSVDPREGKSADSPKLLIDLAVILQGIICKLKRRNLDFKAPYHWTPYMLSGSWFVQRS
ncbi:hypothetical protein LTR84_006536 [Exophiala bonariae]|uniref:CHAT domain-containing protein n=1 Tax=Exophiala bonariae TaxID=1690606 RepID=A0AAV9N0N8_9EURO|nr:hypothetical protein LTR84_006536 [Exophiala bonariae]